MRKLNLAISTLIASGIAYLSTAATALAQNAPTIGLRPPADFANLGNITYATLISGGIRFLLVIAALVFFFMLVIGGIQWILSGGDKAKSEAARGRITSALVGLAIVFVAWAITSLINVLFGVDLFNLTPPKLYQQP